MQSNETVKKINKLIEQGKADHEKGRHASALESYQKAIQLAAPLGDGGLMTYLLLQAGGEHRDCDNYHHAVDLLLVALSIAPEDDEFRALRANIKRVLAITLKDIFGSEKPEVLQLLQEALDDYRQLDSPVGQANIMQHISGVYIQQGKLKMADQILNEALQIVRDHEDIQLHGWLLDCMADLECSRGEWGAALEYARSSRVKVQQVQDREGEGDTWMTEALVFLEMGDLDKALEAVSHAQKLFVDNNNLRRFIQARRLTARIWRRQEKYDEAVNILEEGLQVARRLDLRQELARIHLQLGKIALVHRNFGEAMQHGTTARGLADSEYDNELIAACDQLVTKCE